MKISKESIIDKSYERAFDELLDMAPYISSMPEEYTTGLFSKGEDGIHDEEHLHFPSAEFYELLVWNIVIAFWVNILASFLYDKFFSKNKLKTKSELEKIKLELLDELKKNRISLEEISQDLKIKEEQANEIFQRHLSRFGVPDEERQEKIKKLEELFKNTIENSDG